MGEARGKWIYFPRLCTESLTCQEIALLSLLLKLSAAPQLVLVCPVPLPCTALSRSGLWGALPWEKVTWFGKFPFLASPQPWCWVFPIFLIYQCSPKAHECSPAAKIDLPVAPRVLERGFGQGSGEAGQEGIDSDWQRAGLDWMIRDYILVQRCSKPWLPLWTFHGVIKQHWKAVATWGHLLCSPSGSEIMSQALRTIGFKNCHNFELFWLSDGLCLWLISSLPSLSWFLPVIWNPSRQCFVFGGVHKMSGSFKTGPPHFEVG